MKTALLVVTVIYLVSFLRFAYQVALSVFVHFANQNLGHQDQYFGEANNLVNLVLTIVLGAFTGFGWYAYRHPCLSPVFKWLVFLPLGLVLLYVLFAIVILVSSGGRWN